MAMPMTGGKHLSSGTGEHSKKTQHESQYPKNKKIEMLWQASADDKED